MANNKKEMKQSDPFMNCFKAIELSVDDIIQIREDFARLKEQSLEDTEGYDSIAMLNKANIASQELDDQFLLRKYREMISANRTAFIAQHIIIERLASKCKNIIEQIDKLKEALEEK